MRDYYQEHYELMQDLESNPRIIESPVLYNFDAAEVYAAMMDNIALPLADGRESPFTSKSPGSAHSRIIETNLHIQELIAHEMNLVPYFLWVNVFRMLGLEILPAEYPVINLVFTRTQAAVAFGQDVIIPYGTVVASRFSNELEAITTEEAVISGTNSRVIVPARLNQLGKISQLNIGEFSNIANIPFLESVYNDGTLVSEGRERETLTEAMQRAIAEFRTGERCVTLSDYYNASRFVAKVEKVNVFEGSQYDIPGVFDDLVTVVVYPPEMVIDVDNFVRPRSLARKRLDVRSAEILPIDGDITIKVAPHLTDIEAFNLAVDAITARINPPNGLWGDRNFTGSLSAALEEVQNIFAIRSMNLKHAENNTPLADLVPKPWHLFQIQNSININVVRI